MNANLPKYETHLLQNLDEFRAFQALLRGENVKSFLEIGSKNGGSLFRMAMALPRGSRIVSVDLPHGDHSFKETLPNLKACVERLKRESYDAHLIIGDSTDAETVARVRALGPFDACFIDGNHTLPFITQDWENYGPMCRIVAFHDIGFLREGGYDSKKLPIDAPEFWRKLTARGEHRHLEIKREKTRVNENGKLCCDNGIGVLWH
jgi:hypothetical protein